jgi:hypothetical protein
MRERQPVDVIEIINNYYNNFKNRTHLNLCRHTNTWVPSHFEKTWQNI